MSDIKQHTAEAAAGLASKITMGAGTGVAAVSTKNVIESGSQSNVIESGAQLFQGLTLSEWGIIAGIATAVLSYLTQVAMTWYFNRERLKLDKLTAESKIAFHNANIQPHPSDDDSVTSRNVDSH